MLQCRPRTTVRGPARFLMDRDADSLPTFRRAQFGAVSQPCLMP
jgi:hypothetical protein